MSQPRTDQPIDEDEDDFDVGPKQYQHLNVEKLAAILILSRALRSKEGLQRALKPGEITILRLSDSSWIGPVSGTLRHLIQKEGATLTTERMRDNPNVDSRLYGYVVLTPLKTSSSRASRTNHQVIEECALKAIASGLPIFGICTDIADIIPNHFMVIANDVIDVNCVDKIQLRRLIKMTCDGGAGFRIPTLPGRITPAHLILALRPNFSLDQVLATLGTVTREGSAYPKPEITFHDLHGMAPLTQWADDLKADFDQYRQGKLAGSEISRGVLVDGPPGSGKTVASKAIAQHVGVSLISASVARWLGTNQGHLGDFCGAVMKTFAEAKANAPALLVIDEFDALPSRITGDQDDKWWDAALTAVLEALDGLEGREGVVVMALCNHPEKLDPALVRAGRFDHKISIGLPSVPEIAAILSTCTRPDLSEVNFLPLAANLSGSNIADIARIVRDAKRLARRKGRALVIGDIAAIIDLDRRQRPDDFVLRVAAHEAGHAIAAVMNDFSVSSVVVGQSWNSQLLRQGSATINFSERWTGTWADVEAVGRVVLAGRIAERMVLGSISSGAATDLEFATKLVAKALGSEGLGPTLRWRSIQTDSDLAHLPADLAASVEEVLIRLSNEVEEQLREEFAALQSLSKALVEKRFVEGSIVSGFLSATFATRTDTLRSANREAKA